MKRIEASEVVEAYRKTGLVPAPLMYLSIERGSVCACAIGAMYCAAKDMKPENDRHDAAAIGDWFEESHSGNYRLGFIDGYDNISDRRYRKNKDIIRATEDFKQGYADGIAARAAVEAAFGIKL